MPAINVGLLPKKNCWLCPCLVSAFSSLVLEAAASLVLVVPLERSVVSGFATFFGVILVERENISGLADFSGEHSADEDTADEDSADEELDEELPGEEHADFTGVVVVEERSSRFTGVLNTRAFCTSHRQVFWHRTKC